MSVQSDPNKRRLLYKVSKISTTKNSLAKAFAHPFKAKIKAMVDNFKHADKTKAHAKAEKSGRDWNKGQSGHALVSADLRVVRIPDEHLQD